MNTPVKSQSINGITDLVIWAPIREGFIDAFANVTYESRLHIVAKALNNIRKSAREYETIEPFSDTAERILTLLDFRIGVVDRELFEFSSAAGQEDTLKPGRYMYLVATFDGPWEPYIRLIWKPLGTFLDLVLCNCEGYITAEDNNFEDYARWVRNHQLDSSIFYSTTGLTVKDQNYLSKLERFQREQPPAQSDIDIAGMTSDDPAVKARKVRQSDEGQRAAARLALEALSVLYSLTDYYPADRPQGDGRFLLRVAHDLFDDYQLPAPTSALASKVLEAYKEPLNWFKIGRLDGNPPEGPHLEPDLSEIQKGVLTGYDSDGGQVTHGALVLLQITDVAKFQTFLPTLVDAIGWEKTDKAAADIFVNIAFTHNGLERMGLSQRELQKFPVEFVHGMERRAPEIGDIGINHPRRWNLPARNWPPADGTAGTRAPVELSEVDVAIQLRAVMRVSKSHDSEFIEFSAKAVYPKDKCLPPDELLMKPQGPKKTAKESDNTPPPTIEDLIMAYGHYPEVTGLTLLAVEDAYRKTTASQTAQEKDANRSGTRDHFGFRDGLSQPVATIDPQHFDDVPLGDIVYGYKNSLQDPANDSSPFLFNGSFLAVRKIRQDVKAFNQFLEKYESPEGVLPKPDQFAHGDLAACLVGRSKDGEPLINPANGNEFTYEKDKFGVQCPHAAHIRRTNPRNQFQGRPAPRIMRRGMSYGKPYEQDPQSTNRGMLFMAYNANISEQFEVIQRWINGGNSTDTVAAQYDPLVGTSADGGPHTFRFLHGGEVRRVTIDKPFTQLQWGAYFFAPSKTALNELAKLLPSSATKAPLQARIDNGNKTINRLLSLKPNVQRYEWKIILEDFLTKDPGERSTSSDLWEAIIDRGGALRIEAGVAANATTDASEHTKSDKTPVVLVAKEDSIMQVLSDDRHFSTREQVRRLKQSFGSMYVSQDPGPQYDKESKETNEILFAISEENAFKAAYASASAVLTTITGTADAIGSDSAKFDLRRQYLRPALGATCKYWFGIPDGLPDGEYFDLGSWEWDDSEKRNPVCPGDFLSPSRHAFYPRPTPAIEKYGINHGQRLIKGAHKLIKNLTPGEIEAPILAAMFDKISDHDVLARNLIGIMFGAIPPIDGNMRGVMYDWLEEDTLWRHQGALHRQLDTGASSYSAAKSALNGPITKAISKRPAPDLLYRTVTENVGDDGLPLGGEKGGGVKVYSGETIVLSLVGATQHRLSDPAQEADSTVVFGGQRRAPKQAPEEPLHACPGYRFAAGTMLGIIAALLNAGTLRALPASLIVELSEWPDRSTQT